MDLKLNHSDLSAQFAKAAVMPAADADLFTKAVFDLIIEGLESEGIVKINGLGTFKTVDVESRSSVNVNTGERIEIKGHKKMTFIPSDSLKETINAPFAMFEPVEVDDELEDSEEEAEPLIPVTDIEEEMPVAEEPQSPVAVTDIEEEMPAAIVEEPLVKKIEEIAPPQPEVAEEKTEEGSQPENVDEHIEEEAISEQATEVVPTEEVHEEELQPTEVHEDKSQPVEEHKEKPLKEEPEKVSDNDNKKFLYLILSLFFVTVVAVGGYFLLKDEASASKDDVNRGVAAVEEIENVKVVTITDSMPEVSFDTIDAIKKDTVIAEKDTLAPVPVVQEAVSPEKSAPSSVKQQDFVLTGLLASLELSAITQADTTEYTVQATLCSHTVAIDETLIKISLKYYGDKRLWPYIVKYNNMKRPNDLACGMVLKIPVLRAVK